jgi:hypothetical protein
MGRFGGGRICYHEIPSRSRNLLLLVERPTLMSSLSCIGNRVDKNFHKIGLKSFSNYSFFSYFVHISAAVDQPEREYKQPSSLDRLGSKLLLASIATCRWIEKASIGDKCFWQNTSKIEWTTVHAGFREHNITLLHRQDNRKLCAG